MIRRRFLKSGLVGAAGLALALGTTTGRASADAQTSGPNPIGAWNVNGNGYPGVLRIPSIDSAGNLVKAVIYDVSIVGFWDQAGQKLTFMRLINRNDPSTFQIYTGYLMKSTTDGSLALAGSFEAFAGTGAVAQRVIYGWYATPVSAQ